MDWTCHVCGQRVQPDADGRIRVEGVTENPKGKAWVWGPVVVHDPCRLKLRTPYDDEIGGRYRSTWEWIKA